MSPLRSPNDLLRHLWALSKPGRNKSEGTLLAKSDKPAISSDSKQIKLKQYLQHTRASKPRRLMAVREWWSSRRAQKNRIKEVTKEQEKLR